MKAFRLDFVLLAGAAAAVAMLAPAPWWQTDRDVYERLGREWVVPNCNDFHCFRPLVSWILGRIPGPSLLIWKSYAVLCQAGAGIAMAYWVLANGATKRTARQIAWMTALGSGACYTLFDPYSSDALMHLMAPLLMIAIGSNRFVIAIAASAAGVLAKEFAAVPLIVSAAARAIQGRWREARLLTLGAVAVVAVWAAWQLFARTSLGYVTGPTYSADLTSGGYLVFWLLTLSTTLVLTTIAMVLGGLWLLWPAGLLFGSRQLRQLTLASLPAVLIFNALQQPDRALWNFAFLVMPSATVVMDRAAASLTWALVAAQVVLSVRVGAQLPLAPPARFTFVIAVLLAGIAVWRARVTPVAMATA